MCNMIYIVKYMAVTKVFGTDKISYKIYSHLYIQISILIFLLFSTVNCLNNFPAIIHIFLRYIGDSLRGISRKATRKRYGS